MHCKALALALRAGLLALSVALSLGLVGVSRAQSGAAPASGNASPRADAAGPSATPASSPTAPPVGAQSDPRQAATVAEQARRLSVEKKPADALRLLESGLREHPNDPQLRFLYGVTAADLGRTQDAIEVFRQLTVDFPELPEPHNNLAVLHAAAGDLDRARAALEESVRAAPGYPLAHENLGDLHLRLAVRAYERALQIDGRSASARTKLEMAREVVARAAKANLTPAPRGGSKTPR